MKYSFKIGAAANGGVIVLVMEERQQEFNPRELIQMTKEMMEDPLLSRKGPEPEAKEEIAPGLYIFTNYTKDGQKRRALTQALEFIDIIVEEFGLGSNNF